MAVNFIVLRFPIVVLFCRQRPTAGSDHNEKPRWHRNKHCAASKRHRRFYRKYTPQNIPAVIFSLVGQSFSALGASSLQDVSAVSGSHSLSEAVLLFSLTLFGLISSQHANCTSLLALSSASISVRIFRKRVSPSACGYAFTQ